MIISTDCPHCGTSKVAFHVRFEFQVTHNTSEKYVLGTCNACRQGVIFQLKLHQQSAEAILKDMIGDQDTLKIQVTKQWPEAVGIQMPGDVPESVARYFKQAVHNVRAQNYDAAGVMFRKALEVATRDKAQEATGKPLIKRIDALATAGLITRDMKDWAHQIRLGGNEAAHEDEPFEQTDAERLNRFTEAFLTYCYTLPALVREGTETE